MKKILAVAVILLLSGCGMKPVSEWSDLHDGGTTGPCASRNISAARAALAACEDKADGEFVSPSCGKKTAHLLAMLKGEKCMYRHYEDGRGHRFPEQLDVMNKLMRQLEDVDAVTVAKVYCVAHPEDGACFWFYRK